MAIDTTTPRSRRAVIAGALGGVLASLGLFAKPPEVRAGTDGDLVVDDTNVGVATTELRAVDSDPALKVTGGATGIEAVGDRALLGLSDAGVGVLGASATAAADIPPAINPSTGVYGISPTGVGVYGASDTGHGIYAANNSATKAAIFAEGDPGTAIHGHAGPAPVSTSPASTAIFASAAGRMLSRARPISCRTSSDSECNRTRPVMMRETSSTWLMSSVCAMALRSITPKA